MAMIPWHAESIRVSFFGSISKAGSPLFAEVAGVLPAEQISRPQQSFYQESGLYDGQHYLLIAQQPGRIDLLLSDDPSGNTVDPSQVNYKPFFEVGPYKEVSQLAENFASNLIRSSAIKCQRLAFAPVLISVMPDARSVNLALKRLVKSASIDEDRDNSVFWQINRPRNSKLGSMQINRLSKWQGLVSQIFAFGGAQPLAPSASRFALRLEMDINGPAAANSSLADRPTDELVAFLSELRGLATEISDEGDVP